MCPCCARVLKHLEVIFNYNIKINKQFYYKGACIDEVEKHSAGAKCYMKNVTGENISNLFKENN